MAPLESVFDRHAVPTPALVVDAEIVRRNINRLAEYAEANQIRVRPHTKTHKSRLIAEMQLKAGATGLTAAKVSEAEAISTPHDDVFLAYPPVGEIRARQLAMLARDRTLRAAVDSLEALEIVASACQRVGVTVGLLVDLDVGLSRTGASSPQQALEVAAAIDRTDSVRLDGIMIYPGHIWSRGDQQHSELCAVSAILQETIELWAHHGLSAKIVSGGSTPTAYQSHLIPQLTEIRPGTYVFNDMNTVRGGFCELSDCAAEIVSTIISTSVAGQVVIDAGSKMLAMDRCLPDPQSGHGHVVELPQAKITHLSEEHGQIDVAACDRRPRVGDRLTIIPNHICPCINLQNQVWWSEPEQPLQALKIDARGAVL